MSWLTEVFGRFAEGASRDPAQIRVPHANVVGVDPGRPFVAENDYIVIEVNEFHLDYSRKLWQGFAPSVWVSTQFHYAGGSQSVPVVIGPSRLGSPELGDPQSQLYRNTRVLGPVPYRGGPLGVSLVMSQVAVEDRASQLLSVVESVGAAFDLAVAITPYLRVARAVSDGIDALLRLGTRPLMGVRDTIAADAGAAGGWYVLADVPPAQPLWVIDGRLRAGSSASSAEPMHGCNYVLYSVTALPAGQGRNDVATFPDLAEHRALAEQFAVRPDKRSWIAAKAVFAELGVRMRRQPDLTRSQADQLISTWSEELVRIHREAVEFADKGPKTAPLDAELAEIRGFVADVMAL